jgi:hypothetical protein
VVKEQFPTDEHSFHIKQDELDKILESQRED